MKTVYILWGMLVLTALGINIYFSIEQNHLMTENMKLVNKHLSSEISMTRNDLDDSHAKLGKISDDLAELKAITTANFSDLRNKEQFDKLSKNISSLERNAIDIQAKMISVDLTLKELKGDLDLMAADMLYLRQQEFVDKFDSKK